jgi:hypothetical protein
MKFASDLLQFSLQFQDFNRAKSEGQQRGFLSVRRAKNVENVVGSLVLLHNRYEKNAGVQSFDRSFWLLYNC